MNLHKVASYEISNVAFASQYRFGIACGQEATAKTDPVSVRYQNGDINHLKDLLHFVVRILRPNDRVLDLGAHIGGFALAASAMDCEVIAIEASPRNAELIEVSAKHNCFKKLEVINAAVSDEEKVLDFCVAGPWGSVANPAMEKQFESIPIPAVRVDDVIRQRNWQTVDFVKLDVEGSEVRALRGMSNLLEQDDAPIIYFESNTHTLEFFGEDHRTLKQCLRGAGYKIFKQSRDGLKQVLEEEEQRETCVDYIALKKSHLLPDDLFQPPRGLGKWSRWLRFGRKWK